MAEYIERGLALSAMNVVVTHANAIAGNSVILQKVCGILEDCKNIINDCPAADVAPVVHGEWVVCGEGENVPWVCSHCGKTTAHKYKTMYGKYCPNCGARMDGE